MPQTIGLGAVLGEIHENKTERIVAFASRTSSSAAIHYTVTTPVYHLVKTLCLQFSANACLCVCVCFFLHANREQLSLSSQTFIQTCKFTEPSNMPVMNTTSLPLECHAFHSVTLHLWLYHNDKVNCGTKFTLKADRIKKSVCFRF